MSPISHMRKLVADVRAREPDLAPLTRPPGTELSAFTVDVEDWYQSCVDFDAPITERVVRNVHTILQLLDECGVKGTFFVQGRVAETFPKLPELLVTEGHEVQSHGYSHRPLFAMSRTELRQELERRPGDRRGRRRNPCDFVSSPGFLGRSRESLGPGRAGRGRLRRGFVDLSHAGRALRNRRLAARALLPQCGRRRPDSRGASCSLGAGQVACSGRRRRLLSGSCPVPCSSAGCGRSLPAGGPRSCTAIPTSSTRRSSRIIEPRFRGGCGCRRTSAERHSPLGSGSSWLLCASAGSTMFSRRGASDENRLSDHRRPPLPAGPLRSRPRALRGTNGDGLCGAPALQGTDDSPGGVALLSHLRFRRRFRSRAARGSGEVAAAVDCFGLRQARCPLCRAQRRERSRGFSTSSGA